MSESNLIERERRAVRELLALCARRAKEEAELTGRFAARRAEVEQLARDEGAAIAERFEAAKAEAEAALGEARRKLPAEAEAVQAEAQGNLEAARKALAIRIGRERQNVDDALDRARWEAASLYEAGVAGADTDRKQREARLGHEEHLLEDLEADLDRYLARARMRSLKAGAPAGADEAAGGDPLEALEQSNAAAGEELTAIEGMTLPRLVRGGLPFVLCLLIGVGAGLAAGTALPAATAAGVGLGAAVGVGAAVWFGLHRLARGQVGRVLPGLLRHLERSRRLVPAARAWIDEQDRARRAEIKRKHEQDLARSEQKAAQHRSQIDQRRTAELASIQGRFDEVTAAARNRRDEGLRQAEEAAARAMAENDRRHEAERREFQASDTGRRSLLRLDEQRDWNDLATRWRAGVARWDEEVRVVEDANARLFLDWRDPRCAWTPPAVVAPAMRFGTFEVDPARIPNGLARDDRLKANQPRRADLLALSPFPEDRGSLLLRASGDGREKAVETLQAAMLRLVTSTPPGKLRFTIVDPVGLGQNFAAFMHLADYDEALVTSRIWTEPPHIEKKLAEITEHMEKVIQKYLRNEYASIGEYNAIAGEVAEPFRVLVVANFPANFTEQAARRLVSICQSGPRCGVFTLISADEREPMPPGVTLADLEANSTVLAWREGKFAWKEPDFGGYPLKLDAPPPDETLTRLMHQAGAAAKDANRVEVPFEVVAPAESAYWSEDSRDGIDVPLGRVGATKFQNLRLGRGTSQHVLIAGRTGSGKSTLLHALVTNAALRYSPDEVELYLIDFKKGVEFKTYAQHHLPHARVVAIESEREFGLSVLQRLDEEMKRRGELFRAVNVQDVAGFRDARPDQPMPRVLLIVDEFQEFFVEDDKLAQEAALLLDRLVRQGRAFGIHILLGSQTLGGAFSLARSTLGQMAVRIALQCSEADAHLILSEDNGAARLLSRPGEAIYNDANGMVEGNHFFQVVFLTDSSKEDYLEKIRMLEHAEANGHGERHQIVFEGNLPADLERNPLLNAAIDGPEPAAPPKAPRAWVGDAVAIKDPTAAVFRRQSGANLLIVGQNDEEALGIELAAIVGIAAQFPPANGNGSSARVGVLDGTPDDSPHSGLLARSTRDLPIPVRCGTWRDAGEIINEVAEEVERRQSERQFDEPPVFLLVHDLLRFRDLRKSDDDYSFGGFSRGGEEKPSPGKQFASVLRDGPGVGVHVIVWCDSLNNLNRAFDRSALREFEMRILFQMSPNDSSSLIDSPAAGRIGANRALFSSEEEGRLEKFRPYAPPADAWWADLRRRLAARSTTAGTHAAP